MIKEGLIMKKFKVVLLVIIIFTNVMNFNFLIPKVHPNPLPLPEDYFAAGIIPYNISLNLLNANVVFNIDSTNYYNNIGVNFDGNYTIFNPNIDANITLYAPFALDFKVVNSSCDVQLNGSTIPFEIVEIYELNYNISSLIWDFLSNVYSSRSPVIIVCNMTLSKNSTNIIRYKFNGAISNPLYHSDQFSINYDIGTARAWEGNLTEHIEFKVSGKIPNSYREYTNGISEDRCKITDIGNGRIYIWDWNNERSNVLQVGIIYNGRLFPFDINILIIAGISVSVTLIVTMTILLVKRKRRLKRNIDH